MLAAKQDLKLLQAILDEARGQPGLSSTRKMVGKMVKRIKATQVGVWMIGGWLVDGVFFVLSFSGRT